MSYSIIAHLSICLRNSHPAKQAFISKLRATSRQIGCFSHWDSEKMGACCTKDERFQGLIVGGGIINEKCGEDEDGVILGDDGAVIRLQGYSKHTSMFTQQGRKGINQDAMTVWETFAEEKRSFFCGVFDGHGPLGHRVSQHIRDNLPPKILKNKASEEGEHNGGVLCDGLSTDSDDNEDNSMNKESCSSSNPFYSSWKSHFIKSFNRMDRELSVDSSIDSYCSGSTAVTVLKQDDHLVIANLGDSRAVLGTKDHKDQLIAIQLTVDLKPNLPTEAQRITNQKGRVFALSNEPDVCRVWMPHDNCPGLAMARAFGDFCLKDYGLISVPEVFYRELAEEDEFVVLASDGVWDVLSNNDVIGIVASARNRSISAKVLVKRAVRAWRSKYPYSKVDDCTAICLFFKNPPQLSKSMLEGGHGNENWSDLGTCLHTESLGGDESMIDGNLSSSERGSAIDGDEVSRVNSTVNLPRYRSSMRKRKSVKEFEDAEIRC